MRTQASPDLCAGFKWLIAFNFNLHTLQFVDGTSLANTRGIVLTSGKASIRITAPAVSVK
jgi:hypothetical protein